MRVLHLASSNRWTGAAAPALSEVDALRLSGIDAFYAYIGGHLMTQKIGEVAYAFPFIDKHQNPFAFAATLRRIRDFVRRESIDVIHTHLTYDHVLGLAAARPTGARVYRTFHAARAVRHDPFTRSLIRRSAGIAVINDSFLSARPFANREVLFTPPPVDLREFTPDGEDVRARFGIAPDEFVMLIIGKMTRHRGFEEALQVTHAVPGSRLIVIGRGPHRAALEEMARSLGIADRVIFAGYHEGTELAEHYRAANLALFTAQGSDAGHRAILEEMACGVPVASFPFPGVPTLLGGLTPELMSEEVSLPSLLRVVRRVVSGNRTKLRAAALTQVSKFDLPPAASRLKTLYAQDLHR